MIWLTWRQHRLQLLYGAVVLAILTVFLLSTGFGISAAFRSSGLAQCLSVPGRDCGAANDLFMGGGGRYSGLWFTIPLFLIVPAMVGVFWGAPLVAREVEQGTHRLAWTQGVGRIRWAGTKVAARYRVEIPSGGPREVRPHRADVIEAGGLQEGQEVRGPVHGGDLGFLRQREQQVLAQEAGRAGDEQLHLRVGMLAVPLDAAGEALFEADLGVVAKQLPGL